MWAGLSWKQKVAGVAFCVAKLHSIMAAITIPVNRKLGGYCLLVAALGVAVSVGLLVWDSREKNRRLCPLSDQQLRQLIENDETVRRIVEQRSKEILDAAEAKGLL